MKRILFQGDSITDAGFVEIQNKLDEAIEKEPPLYWLNDGVHPSTMGHELIKREWIKAFDKYR